MAFNFYSYRLEISLLCLLNVLSVTVVYSAVTVVDNVNVINETVSIDRNNVTRIKMFLQLWGEHLERNVRIRLATNGRCDQDESFPTYELVPEKRYNDSLYVMSVDMLDSYSSPTQLSLCVSNSSESLTDLDDIVEWSHQQNSVFHRDRGRSRTEDDGHYIALMENG